MTFDTPAFLTGLILALVLASDALLMAMTGKWLGFQVEEICFFMGKVLRRRIKGVSWVVGWIPMGTSVKVRGLYREEGVEETVFPNDFDQQPFGKQVLLLLIDKVWLAVLWTVGLLAMPEKSFGDALEKSWNLVYFILRGSEGDPGFEIEGSGNAPFILACLSLWTLIFALLPTAGNKTQILLLHLFGIRKEKSLSRISLISGFVAIALFSYTIYCLYQFSTTAFAGYGMQLWVNGLGGALLVGLIIGLLVDAFGKRSEAEEVA